jgi:hypothetical protein
MKIRALFVAAMFSAAALLGLSLLPKVVRAQFCGTGRTPFTIGNLSWGPPFIYLDIDVNQGGIIWATSNVGLITPSYCSSHFIVGFPPNGQHPQTVASAPDGSAWVTTTGNQIYHVPAPVGCNNPPSWTLYPGAGKDIAVTSNGTVWVIGTNATGGGYHIYYWNGSAWVGVEGGATRIAAAPGGAINDTGQPWVVNSYQQILQRTASGGWQGYPGNAYDIGIDRYTGNPWVVGTLPDGGGSGKEAFELFYWNGSTWIGNKTGTGGINISTGFNNCQPTADFVSADGAVHTVTLTPL